MVMLEKMQNDEFKKEVVDLKKGYAEEKVKAGTWTEEEAMQKSEETFRYLLPDGLSTNNHYFLSIFDQAAKINIGYFWYHFDPEQSQKEAFIYNFVIYETERGKGFGKKAITALERHLKGTGVKKLSLHVFGHNERAIHLYRRMKFSTTDLHMSKHL
ncbi:GNAT family N-acetyltransferase [Halobacillus litoralis]|uniref:GNAT family N-acetyltransferase n=1 Tax=Halobacillus litoralis TaxID=45668 RepID=A0A410M7G2_9BACI|nr:GNAT family N-acetyltransferase [Halobacillus litoralis]QAS50871.1 GNAT family N-acetyltransferase [Halobacillus litoralis]